MRIVLAEDDALLAQTLIQALSSKDYDVIWASDGEQAIQQLRAALPSALILDLVLPQLDGLAVIGALPTLQLERLPKVIALSPFRDERIAKRAIDLGAAHVLPKPPEIKRLFAYLEAAGEDRIDAHAHGLASRLLNEIGIPLHTLGGTYLLEAIVIAVRDYEALERLRDSIYRPIAQKNATKPENVERLIRHAIERASTRGRIEIIHRLFGHTMRSETGKPTNAEFIAILAENIRLGLHTGKK